MLYLHIGLHKTATSSLQGSVFPNLKKIKYLGRVESGGVKASDDLYREICDYCFSKGLSRQLELELKKRIKEHLNKGDLLISEEWFTADFDGFYGFEGATWQEKLKKLSNIVSDIEHKVLITIREPLDASFSQYCEFYSVGLNKRYIDYLNYFKYSNDIKVFKYLELNALINSYFCNVRYITFDAIVNNTYHDSLSEFLNETVNFNIQHLNKKNKNKDGTSINTTNKVLTSIIAIFPSYMRKKISKVDFILKFKRKITTKNVTILRPDTETNKIFSIGFSDSIDFYENLKKSERDR